MAHEEAPSGSAPEIAPGMSWMADEQAMEPEGVSPPVISQQAVPVAVGACASL
jgi:hypothetical protein